MHNRNVIDPGVKILSVANWQEADEAAALWRQMTSVAKTQDDWANLFLAPTLRHTVPKEIVKLLETARAAMLYSWYYYPLATFGRDQCFRLLETGARMRCELSGIPTESVSKKGKIIANTFSANIEALKKVNIISTADDFRWKMIREMRNSASHPKSRPIFDPGQAQGVLETTVELLNDFFA